MPVFNIAPSGQLKIHFDLEFIINLHTLVINNENLGQRSAINVYTYRFKKTPKRRASILQ